MKVKHLRTGKIYRLVIDQDSKEKWYLMSCLTNPNLPKSFFNPEIVFSESEKDFNKYYEKI